MTEQRIKFANYHPTWKVEGGNRQQLAQSGEPIIPADATIDMEGRLFCPECFTHVSRSPKERQRFRNGRKACFVHWPRYSDVPCNLRSTKPVGMRFDTEEAAAEALDREDLVLINQFMRDHPTSPESVGVYQQTPVEDIAGPISEVPIARHRGQTFRLPTRISSIQMLCRRLDANLHRYFILPGHTNPQPLYDLLHPVTSISDVDEVPKLYFGKIQRSFIPSPNPQPYHLRMTRLYSGQDIADFFIKQNHLEQESRGIDESKTGHYVIFWSRITPNGIGLCAEHLGWGEYALVPERYTRLLDELSEP